MNFSKIKISKNNLNFLLNLSDWHHIGTTYATTFTTQISYSVILSSKYTSLYKIFSSRNTTSLSRLHTRSNSSKVKWGGSILTRTLISDRRATSQYLLVISSRWLLLVTIIINVLLYELLFGVHRSSTYR